MKIVGRSKQIINLGGFKIVPTEIERVALLHPDVCLARARGVPNPITGQHIEVVCQPRIGAQLTRLALRDHFCQHLPQHFVPQSIRIGEVGISHRFKQA